MRNDTFVTTFAILSALLACGGIASARSPAQLSIGGRVSRQGRLVPTGARATLRLDDAKADVHVALTVTCAAECTFRGHVPAGTYRATIDGAFTLAGHRSLLAEKLEVRAHDFGLQLAPPQPVTISGVLDEKRGCPATLPAVTFRRLADGEEFGAAVSCGADEIAGFAASVEPGEYDVRVELPDGKVATARVLQLRTDVVDLPLGLILPEPQEAMAKR
jgi:hypothetical protein